MSVPVDSPMLMFKQLSRGLFSGRKKTILGSVLLLTLLVYAAFPRKEGPGWQIPTDPQDKAAYDYAHSLKLPDSVPKPVPFNFPLARVKALWPWNPSVSDQYFQHLCNTEADFYLFKAVENVEGFYQMRPRPKYSETPLDFDPYALEGPIGTGWGSDDDNYNNYGSWSYLQPMSGVYRFLEQPLRGQPGKVFRLVRGVNSNPPYRYSNGVQAGVRSGYFRMPWIVVMEEGSERHARYALTWRGLKRKLDRDYAIAGGEYIILDMETGEVLAVSRQFRQSGRSKRTPSRIWWGNARQCPKVKWTPKYFVKAVLHKKLGINDEYIPDYYRNDREIK